MRSTALFVLFVAATMLSRSNAAYATSGDLDPTFGVDGVARTTFSGTAGGSSIARQSDGKIVAAGGEGAFETGDIAVARFDATGVLDPSFNGTGQVTTSVGAFHDGASQVLIQSDGKIVVVGTTDTAADGSTSDVAVVRYNTDGTLDAGFGTGGIVTTHVNAVNVAMAAALQSDDKIVVVGATSGSTFDELVLRYDAGGTLDSTFGTGGIVTLDFGGRGDQARDVLVQPDGGIVLVGASFNGPLFLDGAVGTITRLDGLGTPDATFGTGGSVVFSPQPISIINNVVRQSDGKLVVLAATGTGGVAFRLLRFDTAGAPDGGFTGAFIPFFITNINADALALAPDGKFVVTGFFIGGFQSARVEADGTLDASYGNSGYINNIVGMSSVAIGAVVEPSSDILIVGSSQTDLGLGAPYDITVVRIVGTAPACTSDADCGVCERCGGGGTCEIGARSGCAVATTNAAKLRMTTNLLKSSLVLSWTGTVPAVDPTTTDDVAVCIFQTGRRILKAVAPAAGLCDGVPCWSGSFATKLKYKDKAGTPHGIRAAVITGKKIAIKAKGRELATSPQGIPDAITLGPTAPPFVLQVHGSNGACASATFGTTRFARPTKFKGKSD